MAGGKGLDVRKEHYWKGIDQYWKCCRDCNQWEDESPTSYCPGEEVSPERRREIVNGRMDYDGENWLSLIDGKWVPEGTSGQNMTITHEIKRPENNVNTIEIHLTLKLPIDNSI